MKRTFKAYLSVERVKIHPEINNVRIIINLHVCRSKAFESNAKMQNMHSDVARASSWPIIYVCERVFCPIIDNSALNSL